MKTKKDTKISDLPDFPGKKLTQEAVLRGQEILQELQKEEPSLRLYDDTRLLLGLCSILEDRGIVRAEDGEKVEERVALIDQRYEALQARQVPAPAKKWFKFWG